MTLLVGLFSLGRTLLPPRSAAATSGCVDGNGDACSDPASVTCRRPHLRYDGATLTGPSWP